MEGRARRRLRHAWGWLPAVALVPAGFVAAVTVAAPEDPPAVTREVYPLDVGTTWTYAVSDHGTASGTHVRHVLGDAQLSRPEGGLVNASRVGDHYSDYPGAGPRDTSTYLAAKGDRIDQYGLITADHRYNALDPPAKVFALLEDVGDSWSYQGLLDLEDFGFRSKLTERGPVTVGGHTFEGCSKFVTTVPVELPDDPGAEELLEEWTCPGYGPVRTSDRFDPTDVLVTEELTEFHGEAGNWYAEGHTPDEDGADGAAGTETALGWDEARTNALPDGVLGRELAWSVGTSVPSDFAPVSSGDLMVTGDDAGWVTASDVGTGETTWQVRLAPPVLVTPAVAGETVLVADGEKRLWSLSLEDGSTRWVHDFDDVVTVSPAVSGDEVAVGTDDARLSVLDLASGDERWHERLAAPATTAPATSEGVLYVCDGAGNLTAFDLDDGDTRWSRSLAEGVLLGPTAADGQVLAQDEGGVVYAFAAGDGTLEWESRTRGSPVGGLAVAGDTAVTLTDTTVVALDLDTGDTRWRRGVQRTRVPPVVVGTEVLTVSETGHVEVMSLADGSRTDAWELPRPVPGQRPLVDVPLGRVGDAVVITSDPGTAPADVTRYAYPAQGDVEAGVLLDLAAHRVPSTPTEPVTEAAGALYVPGYDSALTRVDARGRTTALLRNEDRIATGGVTAGDVVVARRDDRLEAIPVGGGDPWWSIEAGNAFAGSVPVVGDGTVYAGASDGRLLAVDLATGALRWSAPTPEGFVPSSPVLLPDGDVVYGVGLARYDAADGAPRWSQPGTTTYGSPAVADGVVYAAADRTGEDSGLGAWDARTGRLRWFLPGAPAGYVGPSVADGVVVWADAFGTVRALDATDGTLLWSVDLHRPVGGVPVVRDGRVYLAGLGRPEDTQQRDYRITVQDLRTGRFLGSWEPPLSATWIVPFVGPGDDVPLLVPTATGPGYVVVGVSPHG